MVGTSSPYNVGVGPSKNWVTWGGCTKNFARKGRWGCGGGGADVEMGGGGGGGGVVWVGGASTFLLLYTLQFNCI